MAMLGITINRRLIQEWEAHLERQGVAAGARRDMMLAGLARIAGEVLDVPGSCDATHPLRESIGCTLAANHAPLWVHHNDQHRLSWDMHTGITRHDDLGEITLEPEPEPELTGVPSVDDMLGALRLAMRALERVETAYAGTSKRITAPIVRMVRDARDAVSGQEAALVAGIKAARDAQAS